MSYGGELPRSTLSPRICCLLRAPASGKKSSTKVSELLPNDQPNIKNYWQIRSGATLTRPHPSRQSQRGRQRPSHRRNPAARSIRSRIRSAKSSPACTRARKPTSPQVNQLRHLGRFDEVERVGHEGFAKFPELGYFSQGRTALLDGKPAEAEPAFRQALEIDPDWIDALIGLGDSLAEQNKQAAAEDVFRKAIEFEPSNGAAHLRLGRCLLKQDKSKPAVEAIRRRWNTCRCRPMRTTAWPTPWPRSAATPKRTSIANTREN